jgi:hypothetical protein
VGSTTTAATALSDINAPQFSIITKALGPAAESGDGKRRFHATASSTIVDRAGHQISLDAIQKMAAKFRDGITIFMDHKNVVGNAYGTTDDAQVIQRGQDKTGTPIWDLDIFGIVNDPNPVAKQLHDSIEGGYVKLGCSIDAFVTAKPIVQKSGSLLIDSLDVFAASVVGVPMNQRSWTQKAVRAVKSFYGEPQEDDVSEDQIEAPAASEAVLASLEKFSEGTGVVMEGVEVPADGTMTELVVEKGDMSAKARDDLADSEFACPEKRKYPINDAAHVRAALSRIADPSNDQCGRDKILAAARRMGIGDHEQKSLMSDEELLAWGAANPVDDEVEKAIDTTDSAALDRQDVMHETCPSCGGDVNAPNGDCADSYHRGDTDNDGDDPAAGYDPDHDGKSIDAIAGEALTKGTTEGGQEADPAATPETAPSAIIDGTDTAAVRKAVAFEVDDVVVLVKHVESLVKTVEVRDETIVTLSKELTAAQTERDRLAAENEAAKQVIEKVMSMPLRAKTVGYIEDFSKHLPDFLAPEVRSYLTKTAGEK